MFVSVCVSLYVYLCITLHIRVYVYGLSVCLSVCLACLPMYVSATAVWNVPVGCIVVGGDFYNRLLIGMLANGGMQT